VLFRKGLFGRSQPPKARIIDVRYFRNLSRNRNDQEYLLIIEIPVTFCGRVRSSDLNDEALDGGNSGWAKSQECGEGTIVSSITN
jgi:hypothetical protein